MMKRIVLAVLLAITAMGATAVAYADTDNGSGIVGTQSP